MSKQTDTRKVWLVEHPTYKFKEDVKDIAARGRLKVIDVKYKDSIDPKTVVEKAPKLTLKEMYKPVVVEELKA